MAKSNGNRLLYRPIGWDQFGCCNRADNLKEMGLKPTKKPLIDIKAAIDKLHNPPEMLRVFVAATDDGNIHECSLIRAHCSCLRGTPG